MPHAGAEALRSLLRTARPPALRPAQPQPFVTACPKLPCLHAIPCPRCSPMCLPSPALLLCPARPQELEVRRHRRVHQCPTPGGLLVCVNCRPPGELLRNLGSSQTASVECDSVSLALLGSSGRPSAKQAPSTSPRCTPPSLHPGRQQQQDGISSSREGWRGGSEPLP